MDMDMGMCKGKACRAYACAVTHAYPCAGDTKAEVSWYGGIIYRSRMMILQAIMEL